MKEYSPEIAKVIMEYLNNSGMKPAVFNQENGKIDFWFEPGFYLRYERIFIDVDSSGFHVYVHFPFSVCTGMNIIHETLSEFLFMANRRLSTLRKEEEKIGVFVPDYSKGDLYYMYIENCEDVIPKDNIIGRCIRNAMDIAGLYSPGFMDILFRHYDAATALEKCEKAARQGSVYERIIQRASTDGQGLL